MSSHKDIRNLRKQKPLGELLFEARRNLDMSRPELSRLTGINENSIVRYEKAGIDEDGTYPPAPKLAAICFHLSISPTEAFWSCLSPKQFEQAEMETYHELVDHPSQQYLNAQYENLLKENRFLREAASCLLIAEENSLYDADDIDWFRKELRRLIRRQEDFEARMLQWGCASLEISGIHTPGPDSPEAWVHNSALSGQLSKRADFPTLIYVWSARKALENSLQNIDEHFPSLADMSKDEVWRASMQKRKSSEDDLASPPSPEGSKT